MTVTLLLICGGKILPSRWTELFLNYKRKKAGRHKQVDFIGTINVARFEPTTTASRPIIVVTFPLLLVRV
jgi:hypothetical protein